MVKVWEMGYDNYHKIFDNLQIFLEHCSTTPLWPRTNMLGYLHPNRLNKICIISMLYIDVRILSKIWYYLQILVSKSLRRQMKVFCHRNGHLVYVSTNTVIIFTKVWTTLVQMKGIHLSFRKLLYFQKALPFRVKCFCFFIEPVNVGRLFRKNDNFGTRSQTDSFNKTNCLMSRFG